MKPLVILLIGATITVLGALSFGEMLAQHYPDGGLWVFLSVLRGPCGWTDHHMGPRFIFIRTHSFNRTKLRNLRSASLRLDYLSLRRDVPATKANPVASVSHGGVAASRLSLSETQVRTYWWWSLSKTGTAKV